VLPKMIPCASFSQPFDLLQHIALCLWLEDSHAEFSLDIASEERGSIRDLYKKAHWQVHGPTFYQLHLLFDKHHSDQLEVMDALAERIQTLGGVALALAHDGVEESRIARAPRGPRA